MLRKKKECPTMKKTPETIEKAAEPVAEKAAETVVEQASKPVTEKAAETAAKPKAAKAKKQPAAKAAPQKTEDIFVQFGSGEWNVSELAERAKAAYLAEATAPPPSRSSACMSSRRMARPTMWSMTRPPATSSCDPLSCLKSGKALRSGGLLSLENAAAHAAAFLMP